MQTQVINVPGFQNIQNEWVRFNRVYEREGEAEGMGGSWGMHGGTAGQGGAYMTWGIRQKNSLNNLNSLYRVLHIFILSCKRYCWLKVFMVFFSSFSHHLHPSFFSFFFFQLCRALSCAASPGHNPLVVTTFSNGHWRDAGIMGYKDRH